MSLLFILFFLVKDFQQILSWSVLCAPLGSWQFWHLSKLLITRVLMEKVCLFHLGLWVSIYLSGNRAKTRTFENANVTYFTITWRCFLLSVHTKYSSVCVCEESLVGWRNWGHTYWLAIDLSPSRMSPIIGVVPGSLRLTITYSLSESKGHSF